MTPAALEARLRRVGVAGGPQGLRTSLLKAWPGMRPALRDLDEALPVEWALPGEARPHDVADAALATTRRGRLAPSKP